uniref:Uncharacterized protein n=1 Tax=Acrobeloides nanus TaxID=290746 RepID=A0A914EMK1_9BILA
MRNMDIDHSLDSSFGPLSIDITPYKWVGLFNSSVYEATMRSGFWTLWEDNGEPVKLRTMKQTTTNMPKS